MKRYKVVLSPRAFRQLGDIERWIEENGDPTVARRYRQAIVDPASGWRNFPNEADRGTTSAQTCVRPFFDGE